MFEKNNKKFKETKINSLNHIEYLKSGEAIPFFNFFPKEFDGWWINLIFPKNLFSTDLVFCMYKNDMFETGSIVESKYFFDDYPDFFISYKQNKKNKNVYDHSYAYMNPKYRGLGDPPSWPPRYVFAIALTRTIFYNKYKIIVSENMAGNNEEFPKSAYVGMKWAKELSKEKYYNKNEPKSVYSTKITKSKSILSRNPLKPFFWHGPRYISKNL